MTYRFYATEQGEFCIDWDTCCQIIRSFHRSQAQNKHVSEVTESQRSKLNPLSWGLPDLTYLEVDWQRVRDDTEMSSMSSAYALAARATFSTAGVDTMVRELKRMQAETRRLNQSFVARQRKISAKAWSSMNEAVGTYQSLKGAAQLIRDLSGSILIGVSTAATGGASAAVLAAGAGTGLKAYGKFQDTGSVGIATVEAVQSLVFSVIPAARGVGLNATEKVVKCIVSGVLDTDKALMQGSEISTALAKGAIASSVSAVGDIVKHVAGEALSRAASPVLARVMTATPQVISKLAIDVPKKVVEDQAKKRLQATAGQAGGQTAQGELVRSRSDKNAWGDAMSFEDDLLLKFAVIDMAKGIGRSWW